MTCRTYIGEDVRLRASAARRVVREEHELGGHGRACAPREELQRAVIPAVDHPHVVVVWLSFERIVLKDGVSNQYSTLARKGTVLYHNSKSFLPRFLSCIMRTFHILYSIFYILHSTFHILQDDEMAKARGTMRRRELCEYTTAALKNTIGT